MKGRTPTGPPRRDRRLILALAALAAGLLAAPARANTIYENGRPHYLGMGDLRRTTPVPGVTVDLPTGALLVRIGLPSFNHRLKHPIAWYFNSQDGTNGPLGKGTSTSLDTTAQSIDANNIDIILPGHRRYRFTGSYPTYTDTRDPEMLGATYSAADGTLTFKDGTWIALGTRMHDRFSNYLDYAHWGNGDAVVQGGTTYPRVNFDRNGSNRLWRIDYVYWLQDPSNRTWTIAYDANGRVTTMTDPLGGVTTFAWTTYTRSDGQVLPLISSITNPRGKVALRAQYDTSGRVTRITAADNGFTQYAYSGALGADGTTTVTDPRNNITRYSYVWPALPSGGTTKYGYRLTSVTDPQNRTTTL